MKEYHVYFMSNHSRTLYVGVTSDLEQRVLQHKKKLFKGFTEQYNIDMLVWFESFSDIEQTIECEKKIKGWRRSKKVALIEEMNPHWDDLAVDWHHE